MVKVIIILKKVFGLLIIVFFVVSCVTISWKPKSELDMAISKAAEDIISKVPPKTKIALFNISTNESALTEYVIEELSVILVGKAKLEVLDRKNLELVMAEHQFQMSGNVNDSDIISISKKYGASSVGSCSITGEGDLRRLRVRVIDVETGIVQSLTAHRISSSENEVQTDISANNVQNKQEEQQKKQQEERYNQLQKVINSSESAFSTTYDYQEKINLCRQTISVIDDFLRISEDQQANDSIKITRRTWVNRYDEQVGIFNSLLDSLEKNLKSKAEDLSKKRHPASRIEKMTLVDRSMTKSGYFINVTNTYRVSMRGAALGITTYDLQVTVKGQINMRYDTIQVSNDSNITES